MFFKSVVSFFYVGFFYCHHFFSVTRFPPITDSGNDGLLNKTLPRPQEVVQPPISGHSKCDIFEGEWVPDPSASYYTNNTCHAIDNRQNCMTNGRPDSGYMYWRWTPWKCKLQRFDPKRFLGLMRNKSMAFIGDSILRNQMQSLLCILSQVEEAVPGYGLTYNFPSSNFTLAAIWSPYLIKAIAMNGVESKLPKLFLDKPDPEWVEKYKYFDYIEIGFGKWFMKTALYYENEDTIVGCNNCTEKNISDVGFLYAYRRAINSTLKYITSSNHKAYTIFRTCIPGHFENGEWNSKGYCNRTLPYNEGADLVDVDEAMHNIEVEEFNKASASASDEGLVLRLLDATHLSLLRPDGHPGPYEVYHPFKGDEDNKDFSKVPNDCLHWCLPGPVDSWNELMFQMLLNG